MLLHALAAILHLQGLVMGIVLWSGVLTIPGNPCTTLARILSVPHHCLSLPTTLWLVLQLANHKLVAKYLVEEQCPLYRFRWETMLRESVANLPRRPNEMYS